MTNFKHRTAIPIRWSDLDEMGHVNNALYLTYLEDARIIYFSDVLKWDWRKLGMILAHVEIDFIKPLFFGDQLEILTRCTRLGNKSFDLEYILLQVKEGKEETAAKAKTVIVMFDYQLMKSAEIPAGTRQTLKEFEGL